MSEGSLPPRVGDLISEAPPRTGIKRAWASALRARAIAPAVQPACALALFVIATALWFSPLIQHLDGSVLTGPSDATSTIRDLWAMERQGETPFTWEKDQLASAPEGVNRVPSLFVQAGLHWATLWYSGKLMGWVAAFNLYLLVSFVLAPFITFLLLRALNLAFFPALFGGYVYGFSPERFWIASAGHAGRAQNWILPLIVLTLIHARRSRTIRLALVAGFLIAGAFYFDAYLGMLALFLALVFAATDTALGSGCRRHIASGYAASVLVLAAALAPPFAYWRLNREAVDATVHRNSSELQVFGARVSEYFLPDRNHPLLGSLVRRFHEAFPETDNFDEDILFFGYSTLALTAITLWLTFRRRAATNGEEHRFIVWFGASLGVLAGIMSVPRIPRLDFPGPAYLLYDAWPYYRSFARFGVLVGLALAVLAALGLAALTPSLRRRWLAPALLAFLAFELAVGPPIHVWNVDRLPPDVRWLREHPGGVVAHYPIYEAYGVSGGMPMVRAASERGFYQLHHGHPTFEGANVSGSVAFERRLVASDLLNPSAAALLRRSGVRYVVRHDGLYRSLRIPPPRVPGSRLRARFADTRIFELLPSPSALRVAVSRVGPGFHPPEIHADGKQWRWLKKEGVLLAENWGRARRIQLAFGAVSWSSERLLRLVDEEGLLLDVVAVGTTPRGVEFGPLVLPPGRSRLRLESVPGPQPIAPVDSRSVSISISPVTVEPAPRMWGSESSPVHATAIRTNPVAFATDPLEFGDRPWAAEEESLGFHAPEPHPDGSEWRWLKRRGTVLVDSPGRSGSGRLVFSAMSQGRERVLMLTNAEGRVLAHAVVGVGVRRIELGPVPIARGRTVFGLAAVPGPERLGPFDPRVGSIYLSDTIVEGAKSTRVPSKGAGFEVLHGPFGFHYPDVQPDGSESSWMMAKGELRLLSWGPANRVTLVFDAISRTRERLLRLEDGRGRVFDTAVIGTEITKVRLGPVESNNGTTRLALVAIPGPERIALVDPRRVTVLLSQITVKPIGSTSSAPRQQFAPEAITLRPSFSRML